MVTPITDAVSVLRAALTEALAPLVERFEGAPKVYWQLSAVGAGLPLIVFQAQDGGGSASNFLSSAGWSGLYTFRALGATADEAERLAAGVAATLAGFSLTTYESTVQFQRSLVLPVENNVHTAALVYQIELFQ